MTKKYIVISIFSYLMLSTAYAADLTEEDMSQCHTYSSLAAKYQAAKQAHKSLDEALRGVDNPNERLLAEKVYSEIDQSYRVAEIKRKLFEQCVKSFALMRESERHS